MTYTLNLMVKLANTDYNVCKKMFWRKGKGVKAIKVLKIQKKGIPVVDPSQGYSIHLLIILEIYNDNLTVVEFSSGYIVYALNVSFLI